MIHNSTQSHSLVLESPIRPSCIEKCQFFHTYKYDQKTEGMFLQQMVEHFQCSL